MSDEYWNRDGKLKLPGLASSRHAEHNRGPSRFSQQHDTTNPVVYHIPRVIHKELGNRDIAESKASENISENIAPPHLAHRHSNPRDGPSKVPMLVRKDIGKENLPKNNNFKSTPKPQREEDRPLGSGQTAYFSGISPPPLRQISAKQWKVTRRDPKPWGILKPADPPCPPPQPQEPPQLREVSQPRDTPHPSSKVRSGTMPRVLEAPDDGRRSTTPSDMQILTESRASMSRDSVSQSDHPARRAVAAAKRSFTVPSDRVTSTLEQTPIVKPARLIERSTHTEPPPALKPVRQREKHTPALEQSPVTRPAPQSERYVPALEQSPVTKPARQNERYVPALEQPLVVKVTRQSEKYVPAPEQSPAARPARQNERYVPVLEQSPVTRPAPQSEKHVPAPEQSPATRPARQNERYVPALEQSPVTRPARQNERHVPALEQPLVVKVTRQSEKHVPAPEQSPATRPARQNERYVPALEQSPAIRQARQNERHVHTLEQPLVFKVTHQSEKHVPALEQPPAARRGRQNERPVVTVEEPQAVKPARRAESRIPALEQPPAAKATRQSERHMTAVEQPLAVKQAAPKADLYPVIKPVRLIKNSLTSVDSAREDDDPVQETHGSHGIKKGRPSPVVSSGLAVNTGSQSQEEPSGWNPRPLKHTEPPAPPIAPITQYIEAWRRLIPRDFDRESLDTGRRDHEECDAHMEQSMAGSVHEPETKTDDAAELSDEINPDIEQQELDPFAPTVPCYLRPAQKKHMESAAAIYNWEVVHGMQALDVEPLSENDFVMLLETTQDLKMPFVVMVEKSPVKPSCKADYQNGLEESPEGDIIGFGYLSVWQPGLAGGGFATTCMAARVNIYVHPDYRRMKIGTSILDRLMVTASEKFGASGAYDWYDPSDNPVYKAPRYHKRTYSRLYIQYLVRSKKPKRRGEGWTDEEKAYDADLNWVDRFLKAPFWFAQQKERFDRAHLSGRKAGEQPFWMDAIIFEHDCMLGNAS